MILIMPLKQTRFGGECPLGVFQIDVAAGGGGYTSDPLEACIGHPEEGTPSCNYFRFPVDGEKFDPAVQCMCPVDMTRAESRRLKEEYGTLVERGEAPKTKAGLCDYIAKKRQK